MCLWNSMAVSIYLFNCIYCISWFPFSIPRTRVAPATSSWRWTFWPWATGPPTFPWKSTCLPRSVFVLGSGVNLSVSEFRLCCIRLVSVQNGAWSEAQQHRFRNSLMCEWWGVSPWWGSEDNLSFCKTTKLWYSSVCCVDGEASGSVNVFLPGGCV